MRLPNHVAYDALAAVRIGKPIDTDYYGTDWFDGPGWAAASGWSGDSFAEVEKNPWAFSWTSRQTPCDETSIELGGRHGTHIHQSTHPGNTGHPPRTVRQPSPQPARTSQPSQSTATVRTQSPRAREPHRAAGEIPSHTIRAHHACLCCAPRLSGGRARRVSLTIQELGGSQTSRSSYGQAYVNAPFLVQSRSPGEPSTSADHW